MAITLTPRPGPLAMPDGIGDIPAPPSRRPPSRYLRRVLFWAAIAAVVVAGLLVATADTTPTYGISAMFARAPGLFPGAPVEVLGVQVGSVTSVRNIGDQVDAGLAVDQGRFLPSKVDASLVAPELLGEPSIELDPGYTGGAALHPGAVIPESRTSVPVSTEQLLKDLHTTLSQINPKAVGNLVTNLAQDLNGQGQKLNTLIAGAAGTLQVLATKADDLGQLSGSLAQLTGTLDSHTAQLSQLITDYDTVTAVVAQHGTQLGSAITQLSQASTALVKLLVPNLGAVEADVAGTTTVTRTLDRNLTSLDLGLSSATSLFAGAERSFTAEHDWIDLNLQLPAGVIGADLTGLIRDRLAGVCRRIAAHHATGLSATVLQTLATCGNPASSYFDPILDEIPAVLNALSTGTLPTAPTPAQLLGQGLATIPGLPGTTTPASTATTPTTSSATTTTAPSAPTTTTGPPASEPTTSTTSTTTTTAPTCLGGVLGGLLPCSSGSSTGSTATGTSGSGGLAAYRTKATASTPSLTPSAGSLLPPLPAGAPGVGASGSHAKRHRRSHKADASTAISTRTASGKGASK